MARRITEVLIDDIDGSEAQETLQFSLEGRNYEIDLSHANADKLRDALSHYTDAGRRVTSRGRSTVGRRPQSGRTAEIRAWARSRGLAVGDRGRIHPDVVAKYDAEHS